MLVGRAFTGVSTPGFVLSLNTADVLRSRQGAQCFAGVQYNLDGSEVSCTAAGSYTTARGDWIDEGAPAGVWVQRFINSGSLNDTDPGSGRLQLTSNRRFAVTDSNEGFPVLVSCDVTFKFYDAASDGNLLDSVTLLLRASWAV